MKCLGIQKHSQKAQGTFLLKTLPTRKIYKSFRKTVFMLN